MPTRLSRTSACCRRFAGREALTVDATFAGALRALPLNLRNDQSFPDKSIGLLGELLWLTHWCSNSWAWRCWRCVSSCWPFRRGDGLPGTSATPDRSWVQTDVLTGSGLPAIQQLRPGGFESPQKLAEVRKCKARIHCKTLDISALSAERRRRSVMDRSWI